MTILGDSWSDDGTNEFPVTNYTVPDPKYYFGGRVANGPVWGEFMVNLSKGALASVENHAYVGAYACPMVRKIFGPTPVAWRPLNMAEQVSKYLAAKARRNTTSKVPNVVVIAGIGYNDYLTVGISQILTVDNIPFLNATTAELKELRAGVIACLLGGVQTLADAGETDIVMSNNILSLDSPILQLFNSTQLAAARALIIRINQEIEQAVTAFQATLPNTKLYYLDSRAIVDTLLQDAVAAGVSPFACILTSPPNIGTLYGPLYDGVPINITECASKGPGYFWLDHHHPTTEYHAGMAVAFNKQFRAWGLY